MSSHDSDPATPLPDDGEIHGSEDSTLGGYFRVHDRPPAYEGTDGHPYTVSVEVEKTPDLRAPWVGFLVFPKWARNGLGVVGHVETPTLWSGRGEDEVRKEAGLASLEQVKRWLDEAIARRDEKPGTEEGGLNGELD